MRKLASLLLLTYAISGCDGYSAAPAETTSITSCVSPRPEMCTREYRPVCGQRDTGIRCVTTPCPSAEWKTYGNACTACADEAVTGYVSGECPR